MASERWRRATACLDYAFQPSVSIHSGVCLGYEALLRSWESAGFASIQEIFDAAFAEQALNQV
ncbi:MAG: GGDEF domain-containing protein, partial [Spirochaetia bacterium]